MTIRAKLIFQRSWTEKLFPTYVHILQEDWLKLKNQLQELKTVKIERLIGGITSSIELGTCMLRSKRKGVLMRHLHARDQ